MNEEKLKKQISELEEKLDLERELRKLTTTTITGLENRDKEHDEQIEKLEKEIKTFKEYQELLQDTDAGNLVIIPYLKKQISELKEQMGEYPYSHWRDDIYGWIKRYTNTEGFVGIFMKIMQHEEVLRDVGKACISVFTILNYPKRVETIEKALKKLDGVKHTHEWKFHRKFKDEDENEISVFRCKCGIETQTEYPEQFQKDGEKCVCMKNEKWQECPVHSNQPIEDSKSYNICPECGMPNGEHINCSNEKEPTEAKSVKIDLGTPESMSCIKCGRIIDVMGYMARNNIYKNQMCLKCTKDKELSKKETTPSKHQKDSITLRNKWNMYNIEVEIWVDDGEEFINFYDKDSGDKTKIRFLCTK